MLYYCFVANCYKITDKQKTGKRFCRLASLLIFFTGLILCVGLVLSSCSRAEKPVTSSFTAMNTYMTVKSFGKNAKSVAAANQLVQQEVERLEKILSTTIEGSDLYKINNSDISKISVRDETAFLLQRGAEFYKITGGAFNPALYPVIREWGFTTGEYKVPEAERIRDLLQFTDFSRVVECTQSECIESTGDMTDVTVISRPAGMQLDFGAIGKGYAGDRAIEILRSHGVSSALLDFGGNIQVLGTKPDGSDWTVGIKNPWGGNPVVAVKLHDACMITSGGYERFFTAPDGHKYIHIFDNATGRPVENELESVTIICREGLYGDALSTSLFVMGLDKAIEFWQGGARDFDFVIITKEKGIVYSAPLEKKISLLFDFDSVKIVE